MDNRELARRAVELARKAGAQEAAAVAVRARRTSVDWRDGKLENTSEATQRSMGLDLYVDGRYASVSTNDLRPEALADFIASSVTLTRSLAADKDRHLPNPELYRGQSAEPIEIEDPAQAAVTGDDRRRFSEAIEAAARAAPDAAAIVSVSTGFTDGFTELERVHSNGFEGQARSTSFYAGGDVTIKDGDRRPEASSGQVVRFRADLRAAEALGREAAERALARRGAAKGKSAVLPVIVENRVAGRLIGLLFGPLSAEALQQKRSFLEGKLGEPLGSKLLTIVNHPQVRRGLGSRRFDSEGLASRPRPVIEAGVLRSFFVDTYYGKKLGMAPTSGDPSNLEWKLGERSQRELVASAGDGVLITAFLGGNSNATTGDFSLGVQGFRIVGGKLAEPFTEMNLSGNQTDLWKRLTAVGNDPYLSSAARTPTLAFDGLQIAGV